MTSVELGTCTHGIGTMTSSERIARLNFKLIISSQPYGTRGPYHHQSEGAARRLPAIKDRSLSRSARSLTSVGGVNTLINLPFLRHVGGMRSAPMLG